MSENKVFKEFYVELEEVCRELSDICTDNEFHALWRLSSKVERLKKMLDEEKVFKRLRESMDV